VMGNKYKSNIKGSRHCTGNHYCLFQLCVIKLQISVSTM